MEILNQDFKVSRLDFTYEVLRRNPVLNLHFEINVFLYPSSDNNKKTCRIGVRIVAHVTDIATKKEAIGYIFEYFGDFNFPTPKIENDKLLSFIIDSFLSFEAYFSEHKPDYWQPASPLVPRGNELAIAERIVEELSEYLF